MLEKIGLISLKKYKVMQGKYNLAVLELNSVKGEVKKPVVKVNIGDPTPVDGPARKAYIARVAAFHKEVMRDKILAMISDVHSELEKVDIGPVMDQILKGTINSLWLIYNWGEQCINEQIANQNEELTEEERELLNINKK